MKGGREGGKEGDIEGIIILISSLRVRFWSILALVYSNSLLNNTKMPVISVVIFCLFMYVCVWCICLFVCVFTCIWALMCFHMCIDTCVCSSVLACRGQK